MGSFLVTPRTQLDRFAPRYEFSEVHSIRIAASGHRAYQAVRAVTADEILFFRTLVWIRRFGGAGAESILNPSKHTPLLEVATRTSFVLLADEPDREIVVGTVVIAPPEFQSAALRAEDFSKIHEPGVAVAAMNFLIEDAGPNVVRVTTESRVHTTDAATRRRFGMYWRVIYPGSALIRRMWLRAIKRRAEGVA